METRYCPNCMRVLEKRADHRLCPSCGFDFSATPQPQNALPWYTRLNNRYIVGRVLGQGGFGITYIGFDTNLECKVAIKEYYPRGVVVRDASQSHSLTWPTGQNTRQKESGCDSFLREARKMAKIGSIPGIVRVIDTFTENDTSYIIMDYLEGVTLRKYIATNGCMSFERCFDMLRPLCGAIDRMHQKNMIHRDISPDNIMVRGDGTLWLLDFGAAKDIEVNMGTESSAVVAKKGFSPSEQYSGKNIGPWTDVYALCATIYYCVNGRTLPDISERVQDDSILWEPGQVSEDIREAIRDGLSMRYSDRIQSIPELMDRLDGGGGRNKGLREDKERKQDDRVKDNTTGSETEIVTGDKRDDGYSVSIDPINEITTKQKRNDLFKKVIAAAVAAVLLIGGAAFALSSTTADEKSKENEDGGETTGIVDEENADVEYVEEKVYRYDDGGYGIYTGDWLDGHPNGSGTMTIIEEVPLSGGQSLQAGAIYTCETWKNGYMNGYGTAEFSDGGKYEGDWSGGTMDGQGVMTYAGGTIYVGEWANGLRNGQGTITYSNGNTYEGGWKDDLRDGHGVVVRTNGETFEADWIKGEQVEADAPETPEAPAPQTTEPETSAQQSAPASTQETKPESAQQSTPASVQQSKQESAQAAQEETSVTNRSFKNSNGYTYSYTGEVSNGKPNGTGTGVYKESGAAGTYKGAWKNGEMEGSGTYTWTNGEKYTGNWSNSKMSGTGTFTWPDGRKYVGDFKNNTLEGQGTFTFADGSKFVGAFSGGEINGKGVLYNADGSVAVSGTWKNSELVSEDPVKVTNQSFTFVTSEFSVSGTYTGEWKDGKPHGEGTMTMKEHNNTRWGYGDTLWSKNWVNGLIEGYGEWRSTEMGGHYDGNFSSGLKNGYGKMWFDDGTVYDGQWRNGDFVG